MWEKNFIKGNFNKITLKSSSTPPTDKNLINKIPDQSSDRGKLSKFLKQRIRNENLIKIS